MARRSDPPAIVRPPIAAARELVERSCREQGIPVPITDPAALGRICDLLLLPTGHQRVTGKDQ